LKICPRICFKIGFVYGAMEFGNENVMHRGVKVASNNATIGKKFGNFFFQLKKK
jgi:hypothetical protein